MTMRACLTIEITLLYLKCQDNYVVFRNTDQAVHGASSPHLQPGNAAHGLLLSADGETWRRYGETLEDNLQDLSPGLKRGAYRAKPVRRAYIAKTGRRQQQVSFFNRAYGQHMYHPMLVFERHSGCLLAARLRPRNASSYARIVLMLLLLVSRLQSAFPGVQITLGGDAGFALPLLYEFCEFFAIGYALGIPANCVFKRRTESRQKRLKRRYRRTQLPQLQQSRRV